MPKSSAKGLGCLFVFAFPFAGVGVVMVGLTLWSISDWWSMRSWVEVPATLTDVRLETHHDGDSTTHLAVAKYSYEYQERQFTGDRVAIGTAADNIGNFHKRVVDELESHRRRHEQVPCFVNPSSPDESVLYRDLRIEIVAFYLLFALVFGGAGSGLMLCGVIGNRRLRRQAALEQQHPGEPWMWRDDWARGQVESTTKQMMLFVVFFATMWNLISAPAVFCLPGEIRKENYLALIALVFPTVGVGLAVWAAIAVRRWMRFGTSVLQMGSVPGIVGGPLAGVVHTTVHLSPTNGFHQTLSCIRRIVTGSGKHRNTQEKVLWQTTKIIEKEFAEYDHTKSAIPVHFNIPYESEPSSPHDRDVVWRLEIRADTAGVDYYASFEVPVFRTDASSAEYQPDETAITPFVRQESTDDVYRGCRVDRCESTDGLEIRFPLFRNAGTAIGVTIFLAIWTGFIVLMFKLGTPLLFPILFGLFELLIGLFAVDLWFWHSSMRIASRQVNLQAGIAGFSKTHTLSVADIKSVDVKTGMQSGQKLYYDLHLTMSDGTQYGFGKRVAGQEGANVIANDVRQALGLKSPELVVPSCDDSATFVR